MTAVADLFALLACALMVVNLIHPSEHLLNAIILTLAASNVINSRALHKIEKSCPSCLEKHS